MPQTKQAYHFDIGNSTSGLLGLCAVIRATSPREALEILKANLPEEVMISGETEDVGYIQVYLNDQAIQESDVTEISEEDES